MPVLIKGSGGKKPKLQTKTLRIPDAIQTTYSNGNWSVYQDSNGFKHMPDSGYDGFESVSIYHPKTVHYSAESARCIDASTLELTLSSYYFTGLESANEKFRKAYGIVVFHSNPALSTGDEITSFYCDFKAMYLNSVHTFYMRYFVGHQNAGMYSPPLFSSGNMTPDAEYNVSTRKMTITLPKTWTDKTDGYGARFCTSGNYHGFMLCYV